MDGRSELFVYLGAALATMAALFGGQALYASYIDVEIIHGGQATAPQDAKMVSLRAAEEQKLSSGALPIERAIEALAQRGRGVSNQLAPVQSTDLSAMSGWIDRHNFKPYTPHVVVAAVAPVAVPADVAVAAEPPAAPAVVPATKLTPAPKPAPAAPHAHPGAH